MSFQRGKYRKGGIDDSLFMVVDFIILIIVLFLVYNMTSSSKPYDQIAVANLDKLAGAIQKLCVEGNTQTIKFELEQPKPLAFLGTIGSTFNAFFDVGKRAMLSINGDPLYTIYYESFPPGDAWAWEEHLEMPQRAVIYYKPEKDEAVIKNAKSKLEKYVKDNLVQNYQTVIPYVFGNVVLENYDKKISGWTSPMLGVGGAGLWDTEERSQKAFYLFGQLSRFNEMEKSMIKYRACGENTLCMKTTSGIVSVPLTGCEGINDYEYIGKLAPEGVYEDSLRIFVRKIHSYGDPTQWLVDLSKELGKTERDAFVVSALELQNRPLVLASPCVAKEMEIRFETCSVAKGHGHVYPLYEIRNVVKDDNGNEDFDLYRVGYYTDNREFDIAEKQSSLGGEKDFIPGKCIVIEIKDRILNTEFCYSVPGTMLYQVDEGNKPKVKDMGNYVLLPETSGAPHGFWSDAWGAIFGSWDPFWPR